LLFWRDDQVSNIRPPAFTLDTYLSDPFGLIESHDFGSPARRSTHVRFGGRARYEKLSVALGFAFSLRAWPLLLLSPHVW